MPGGVEEPGAQGVLWQQVPNRYRVGSSQGEGLLMSNIPMQQGQHHANRCAQPELCLGIIRDLSMHSQASRSPA